MKKNRTGPFIAAVLAHKGNDCLAWPFADNGNGYGQLTVAKRHVNAHRLVCDLAHGKAPSPQHQVAHSCGNGLCVNHRHLRWATPKENCSDKKTHGTDNAGIRHPLSKLSEQDVFAIRASGPDKTQQSIADEYGVTRSLIGFIKARKLWRHI